MTYDVMGRVLTMRNPLGNVTTYAYDGLGRRTSLSNPLGLQWLTAYADVGNTTQTTQTYPGANDSTAYDVTRTFDRMGRLTGIQYGDTATTPDIALEYDLAGNRSRMSETDSTTTIQRDYAYDPDVERPAAATSYDPWQVCNIFNGALCDVSWLTILIAAGGMYLLVSGGSGSGGLISDRAR